MIFRYRSSESRKERRESVSMKKEFDPTICFSFFADWLEVIEETETEADYESESYMLFKAIANYGLYGETPDFDTNDACKSFRRFWPMLERQIDKSVSNRKRGFLHNNGPTENAKKVIDAYKENPDASIRSIAEMTGISKSEVYRIKRKYIHDISATPKASPGASASPGAGANPSPIPSASPIPSPNTSPNTNTSTGHGTGRDRTGHGTAEGTGKPHISLLDKILDYLWGKHGYGKETIEFDEDREGIIDLEPTLFYVPPCAWKQDDGSTDTECPVSIWDRWDSMTKDGGEMPF